MMETNMQKKRSAAEAEPINIQYGVTYSVLPISCFLIAYCFHMPIRWARNQAHRGLWSRGPSPANADPLVLVYGA